VSNKRTGGNVTADELAQQSGYKDGIITREDVSPMPMAQGLIAAHTDSRLRATPAGRRDAPDGDYAVFAGRGTDERGQPVYSHVLYASRQDDEVSFFDPQFNSSVDPNYLRGVFPNLKTYLISPNPKEKP
jgi:hypothetical protein